MAIVIDPNWSFEEALSAAWKAYPSRGVQFGVTNRLRFLLQWANVVGADKAMRDYKDAQRRGLLSEFSNYASRKLRAEFGRMPTFQAGAQGRDHNPRGFTVWLAGAGVKGGVSHGATDDFGHKAVEKVTTIYDLHATVLHLLGLDHEKLTYPHSGRDERLTDVAGRVVEAAVG